MKHWNSKLLEQLLQVQETDLKIRKLDLQIQVFHQKSKEEDGELSRIKAEIIRIDEALTATESQNQMYATTLEDIRSAIKGLLTTKTGAPKPRTRSSTEALKIEEEKLESLLEETGEQLIRLKENRESLVVKADNRTQELETDNDGPEAEIRKLQQQIRRFEKQREEEIQGIPQLLLKHYDRLRSSRSGVGLTILKNGVCTVCCMTMPTAIASKLSHGEKISMCPACGRMVARIEHIATPEKEQGGASEDGGSRKSKKEKKSLSTSRETADERKAALKKTLKRSMEKKFSGLESKFDEEDIMVPISESALIKRESKANRVESTHPKRAISSPPPPAEQPAPVKDPAGTAKIEKTSGKAAVKNGKVDPADKKSEKTSTPPAAGKTPKAAQLKKAAKIIESKTFKKKTEKADAAAKSGAEATAASESKPPKKKHPPVKKSEKEPSVKKPASKTSDKKPLKSKPESRTKKVPKTSSQKAAAASKSTAKKLATVSKKGDAAKVQPTAKKNTKKSKSGSPKSVPPKPAKPAKPTAKKSGKSRTKK